MDVINLPHEYRAYIIGLQGGGRHVTLTRIEALAQERRIEGGLLVIGRHKVEQVYQNGCVPLRT